MKEFLRKLLGKDREIKKEIAISVEPLETRVAFLTEGTLEDYRMERPSEDRLVGSIFKGKIQNLEDGLQAAFVDIGMKKNAFIHYWDMIPEDNDRLEDIEGSKDQQTAKKTTSRKRGRRGGKKKTQNHNNKRKRYEPGEMEKLFPVGAEIIVQVVKGAIGTKGPRVTANLSIPGRYLVMMPGTEMRGVSKKIGDAKERERLKKVLNRLPEAKGVGFIVRTAGEGARKTAFARDFRILLNTWETISHAIENKPAPCRLYAEPRLIDRVVRDSLTEDVGRILINDRDTFEQVRDLVAQISRRNKKNIRLYEGNKPLFEYLKIDKQIDSAQRRKIWLPSGGYLIFDETEALVAIDINTGRHKGSSNQEEAITEVNLEAAKEIARQLRLRNVGGLVVIDFIDMKQRKNRNLVHKILKDALREDRARTNVLPISELGLLEMTRQRERESIDSRRHMSCPYCHGQGKIKSDLSISVELQRHLFELKGTASEEERARVKIHVHPRILDRLRQHDEAILVDFEKKHGMHLAFIPDPNLHVEEYFFESETTNRKLYSNVKNH